jgi:hypothetical protein
MDQLTGAEVERGGAVAALVLAGCDNREALPAPDPWRADLGQQVNFQLISKHKRLLGAPAFPVPAAMWPGKTKPGKVYAKCPLSQKA